MFTILVQSQLFVYISSSKVSCLFTFLGRIEFRLTNVSPKPAEIRTEKHKQTAEFRKQTAEIRKQTAEIVNKQLKFVKNR